MAGRGIFVTLEGGEGSGKSTQAGLLAERLRGAGREVVFVREPGGTPLGEELRRILLHGDEKLSAEAETLLFLAARAELVSGVVRPALGRGAVVVCDRFGDSTVVYQGYGRGLGPESIQSLNRWATGGLQPDLTVLLDIPVDVGLQRKHGEDDTFHREDHGFHTRVREGFRYLAAREPARWLVLDATEPAEKLAEAVSQRVEALLARG